MLMNIFCFCPKLRHMNTSPWTEGLKHTDNYKYFETFGKKSTKKITVR